LLPFAAHLPRLAFGLVAFLGPINALAAGSGVVLEQGETQLRVTWPMSAKESGVAVFSLDETKPLIESLGVAGTGAAGNSGDAHAEPRDAAHRRKS